MELENGVHYSGMKNLRFSADEDLIGKARLKAKSQHRNLNAVFRKWLEHFVASEGNAQSFDALMINLRIVDSGGHFTRDELNKR